MFYRPGGTDRAPNRQQDYVYADFIGATTDWLPVSKGDNVAINISRASLTFETPASSKINNSPVAGEYQIILEQKFLGGHNSISAPIDQWQNLVVATSRNVHRQGWIRLKIVNLNNGDGTGIFMSLEVNRTGVTGAVT